MATVLHAALAVALSACSLSSGLGATQASAPAGPASSQRGPSASSGPGAPSAGGMLVVPDMIGMTPDEARAIVRSAGFTTEAEPNAGLFCRDAPADEGRIDCQSTDPGSRASRYAMIQFHVHEGWNHPGMLVRAQMTTILGLTVEQAKQRLEQLGHDGPVIVGTVPQFDPACGQDRVCATPQEGGVDVHGEVRLEINPKLDISEPAP